MTEPRTKEDHRQIKSSPKGAQALERRLDILQFLANSGGSSSVSVLSEQLGLPLSTTFRLLKVLEQSEFIFKTHSLAGGISVCNHSQLGPHMNDRDVRISCWAIYAQANVAIRGNGKLGYS